MGGGQEQLAGQQRHETTYDQIRIPMSSVFEVQVCLVMLACTGLTCSFTISGHDSVQPLKVNLLQHGGWTRWSPDVPSTSYHSVILRYLVAYAVPAGSLSHTLHVCDDAGADGIPHMNASVMVTGSDVVMPRKQNQSLKAREADFACVVTSKFS